MSTHKVPAFTPSYLLLQQEGYLISSCLSTGLTELRSAHVHNKGAFYTALFNLSVGIERLLKAIVIIDHMLTSQLAVPNKNQLQGYGHNIVDLYDVCVTIGTTRRSVVPNRSQLDAIDQELLQLISDFARVTRYRNLDALSASQIGADPLGRWGQLLSAILNSDVSQKRQDKLLAQASAIASAVEDVTLTLMHGLDQDELSTAEALALPALHDQATRFAVWRLIKFLAPIRDLLSKVSHEGYGLGLEMPPFPQMHEFLEWLWDDRQYVLRKKRWP